MIKEKKHILIALAAIMLVVGSVFTVRAVRERNSNPLLDRNLDALLDCEVVSKYGNSFIVTKVSPCEYKCDAGGSEGCPMFW